jgi:hypothetical protein
MALSRRSKNGIDTFNRVRSAPKPFTYLAPTLDLHEKALRLNAQFDKEKSWRDKRNDQILRANS